MRIEARWKNSVNLCANADTIKEAIEVLNNIVPEGRSGYVYLYEIHSEYNGIARQRFLKKVFLKT